MVLYSSLLEPNAFWKRIGGGIGWRKRKRRRSRSTSPHHRREIEQLQPQEQQGARTCVEHEAKKAPVDLHLPSMEVTVNPAIMLSAADAQELANAPPMCQLVSWMKEGQGGIHTTPGCSSSSGSSSIGSKRVRGGGYRCGKCGQLKSGHICPFAPGPSKMVRSAGTQCDLRLTTVSR